MFMFIPAFSTARYAARQVAREASREGLEERTVPLGAGQVHYWAGGEGAPVMLIHGFGGDGPLTWRPQISSLSGSVRLIIPDLLSFGGSTAPEPPWTLDAQVDAMEAVLDAEGLDHAAVVGISYGGFVALQLAREAPERVDRLVLCDSPGPEFSEADEAALLERAGAASVQDIFIPDTPDEVERLIGLISVNPRELPKPILDDLLDEMFSGDRHAWASLLQDLRSRRDDPETLEWRPSMPTMLIWGEGDRVFPVEIGERLFERLDVPLTVIPGAAHGPPTQAPRAFDAALMGFLGEEIVSRR